MKKEIPSEVRDFTARLSRHIQDHDFIRLVLSGYKGTEPDLKKCAIRLVSIKGRKQLSFAYGYRTKDITRNHDVAHGARLIGMMLSDEFQSAHLFTKSEDIRLVRDAAGAFSVLSGAPSHPAAAESTEQHDRQKQRQIDSSRPYLKALGITDDDHKILPSMNDKWRQINKFVEIFNDAIASSGHSRAGRMEIADFGSGKGYLTFAIHDFLTASGTDASVTGVEIRDDLVMFCNDTAAALDCKGLTFRKGTIAGYSPARLDVLIALHACDTATDQAISLGIKSGARVIMCAPCCHKEIRPLITAPEILKPILKHGINAGQEAEMLTDTIRALVLETQGYQAKIFEFISPEHTGKNKMILGIYKGVDNIRQENSRKQLAALKEFYGINRPLQIEELLKG